MRPRKMIKGQTVDTEQFLFRGLHNRVKIGTASDRYSGWLGQIYSPDLYTGRITKRTNQVGGKSYVEEVLPVDSLTEYFQHFDILEVDYTYYGLLLEQEKETATRYKPSQNYHVLTKYREYLNSKDGIILKVPQVLCSKRLYRSGKYADNKLYLNAEIFTKQFYEPAVKILGTNLTGFIFEQEYHRRQDRLKVEDLAKELDTFFSTVPKDTRYHLELRTDGYLKEPVFEVMRKHHVGQVLSHWTWLPRLLKQFAHAGNKFINPKQCIMRLITPIGIRYEDAYSKAFPFDKMVDGMMQPDMIAEAIALSKTAAEKAITMNIIINNRAGGNAPLIAREIVNSFM
jgi:uncharacterized protein YecE (DUF72 family)